MLSRKILKLKYSEIAGNMYFQFIFASSKFSVGTNGKRCEACNFLSIWLVKLNCTAQACFSELHKYYLVYLQLAVYKNAPCVYIRSCTFMHLSIESLVGR